MLNPAANGIAGARLTTLSQLEPGIITQIVSSLPAPCAANLARTCTSTHNAASYFFNRARTVGTQIEAEFRGPNATLENLHIQLANIATLPRSYQSEPLGRLVDLLNRLPQPDRSAGFDQLRDAADALDADSRFGLRVKLIEATQGLPDPAQLTKLVRLVRPLFVPDNKQREYFRCLARQRRNLPAFMQFEFTRQLELAVRNYPAEIRDQCERDINWVIAGML